MATMDAPTRDPSTTHSPLPPLPKVTLSLWELVPTDRRHYFNRRPGQTFHHRTYEFGSSPQLMPLVRAYLDTCAAGRGVEDFQYVFTLLGSELASNALHHSRSGQPGGRYTLTCRQFHDGLQLECADQGDPNATNSRRISPLTHSPGGLALDTENGRGLAMVDLLAMAWGDNGFLDARQVWFFLDFGLRSSSWNIV